MGQTFSVPPIAPGVPVPPASGNQVLVTNLAGTQNIPIAATSYQAVGSFVRPSNTTPYTGLQIFGTTGGGPFAMTAARVNGGSGIITAIDILDEANQPTLPSFTLILFSKQPATYVDAATVAFTDTDLQYRIGIVTPMLQQIVNNSAGYVEYAASGLNYTFVNQDSTPSKHVYGYLIINNAYTPISAEGIRVTLSVLAD